MIIRVKMDVCAFCGEEYRRSGYKTDLDPVCQDCENKGVTICKQE